MTRLISAELFKLKKRLMTRVLLFVLIGIVFVLYMLLFAITKADIPGAGPHDTAGIAEVLGLTLAIPFALTLMSSFGVVLAVILIASTVGNEYSWRTIRTMLTCSESRFRFLAAKLVSVCLFILAGMIIGLAAGFIMSLITTAIGGYSFDFSFITGSYLWHQFLQFWRTFYVIMLYVLLALFFSVLGRSTMPGIAAAIGIFFLESIITTFMAAAGGWVARVPDYLLSANVGAINSMAGLPGEARMGFGSNGFETLPGPWHAAGIVAVYALIFLTMAFYLFRKRDVTG